MKKTLFKKQMMEIFAGFFRNRKSGKKRSVAALIGFGVLWVYVFGIMGFMFGMVAVGFCEPLLMMDMGWMYWCLMGLIAMLLGVVGSVFTTYNSLYKAKDNDLLLSMPIPAKDILFVRLSSVYALGLLYELLVMIPAIIVWFIYAPLNVIGIINVILMPFVLSFAVLVLSAILGWVVALVMSKVRRKNFVTVVLSLLFIGVYYYVYGQAYDILQTILLNAGEIGQKMKIIIYPLYQMGQAAEGSILGMLIFVAFNAAITAVTYYVLSVSFFKLATISNSTAKVKYKERTVKESSVVGALVRKELRRFLGSSIYMLNCGLSLVIMPIAAVVLLVNTETVREFLTLLPTELLPLFAAAIVFSIEGMIYISACSVSLEGKNLWILRSMPVPAKKALQAKLTFHIVIAIVPALMLTAAVLFVMQSGILEVLAVLFAVVLFLVLMASFGLMLNLLLPNLTWTNEAVPVKSGASASISMFSGWIITAILGLCYYLLMEFISPMLFLLLADALLAALCGGLLYWIFTKGARIFDSL